jgi:beta-galactosidase
MVYLLRKDGSVKVELFLSMGKKVPEIPRIGITFGIPEEWKGIKWYGRGPQENYRDRKTGAAIGLYQIGLPQWITNYVRPQDNSNRTDVRWIEFTNMTGSGLRVHATNNVFGVTAWPYTQEDLEATTHDYLLPHRNFITVNVDGFQMGVGGDISWGLPVHKEYRILEKGDYTFSIEIQELHK